jgi:hypothetical protein
MRENGIPKLLTSRWAPFAALVLGSLSFVGFVTLTVPEHIGDLASSKPSSLKLGSHLSRTQTPAESLGEFSDDRQADGSRGDGTSPSFSQPTRMATHGSNVFPKRGFTPPLDRPEQEAAPPPPPPAPVVMPPPQAEAVPAPAPEPVAVQPDLPPPGSGPAPGPVTPQND